MLQQNLLYSRWVVNHFIHATSAKVADDTCFDICATGFWNNASINIGFFHPSTPNNHSMSLAGTYKKPKEKGSLTCNEFVMWNTVCLHHRSPLREAWDMKQHFILQLSGWHDPRKKKWSNSPRTETEPYSTDLAKILFVIHNPPLNSHVIPLTTMHACNNENYDAIHWS